MSAITAFTCRWMGLGLCLAAALAGPAQGQIIVEAAPGEPFGVGRIDLPLPPQTQVGVLGPSGLLLTDREGRLFYPAVANPVLAGVVKDVLERSNRPLPRIIGGFLDMGGPRATFHFLFRGTAPLQVTVGTQPPTMLRVTPVSNPNVYRRLILAWWRTYTAPLGLLQKKPDYPPIVENYLQSMLARRLGLKLPPPPSGKTWLSLWDQEAGLTADTETIRMGLARDRMLGESPSGLTADQPLPGNVEPPPLAIPALPADVKVEPIAMRVPADCFYVRFGSFPNFLWFQDTMARWGGDIRNLVGQRGLETSQTDRVQRQLVLQTTAMARVFGQAVIADAALVGGDLLMNEGSAIGTLFLAANSALLSNDLSTQRREAMKADKTLTDVKVQIAGRDVSLLASPDNRVRSFYAADGDFHFVTNSRALAQRFIETKSATPGLGATPEFRYARTLMPVDRGDTIFAYLSDAFFRRLTGATCRIETIRRLRSLADIELVELARLVSAAEGKPGANIAELSAGGFLPPQFGPRPDGSQTVLGPAGAYDSIRGLRGSFIPLADVEVSKITASEAETYARFAENYKSRWGRIDPLMAGVQRKSLEGKRERVTIDALMAPLERQTYDFLTQWLGAPDQQRLAPVQGDVLSWEVILGRQRLFSGMRDFAPPADVPGGEALQFLTMLATGKLRDMMLGYVGTAGADPGALGLLDRFIASGTNQEGYATSENQGLWRRRTANFLVYSFHGRILAEVTPQLRLEKAERPAQFRLRASDLSQSNVAPLANRWIYSRSQQTTLGNIRLLHSIQQQLRVPGKDALAAASAIMGAKLVCPLRGQYEYRDRPEGGGYWTSTALEKSAAASTSGRVVLPDGFEAPPMNWFRGLMLDAQFQPDRISAHAEVDMQLPATAK